MSVEKELKSCLLYYPSIFPNKWAVYHHWFAVNGNGYEWVKGSLIDGYEKDSDDSELTIENALEKAKLKTAKSIVKENNNRPNGIAVHTIKFYMDELERDIKQINNLDKRMVDFIPKRKGIYPLCQYSQILHVPTNVKPDWLKAANEFKSYLLKEYDTFKESDQKWIEEINKINLGYIK